MRDHEPTCPCAQFENAPCTCDIAEVCGESFDHALYLISVRDGIVIYECERCGAEIVDPPEEEGY